MIRFFDIKKEEEIELEHKKVDNIAVLKGGVLEIVDIEGNLYESYLVFFE